MYIGETDEPAVVENEQIGPGAERTIAMKVVGSESGAGELVAGRLARVNVVLVGVRVGVERRAAIFGCTRRFVAPFGAASARVAVIVQIVACACHVI